MSSVNKAKYITHIAHLSTAAILQQAGIERCPKSGMQILTDLLICYIKMLGDRLGSCSTMLTHRSPHSEFTDAILLLECEYGSPRSSVLWADLEHFLDRQRAACGSVANGPSLLSVLWGLPLRLDIEGKPSPGSRPLLNQDHDQFLYPFLPPYPLKPSVSSVAAAVAAPPPLPSVQDVEMKSVESQTIATHPPNPVQWQWEEVQTLDIDPALGLGLGLMQIDCDSRPVLLEQNPCSMIPSEIADPPGRLAIGTLDRGRIGVQKLWRQPLWISGECQVMQFLKEPTQPDTREAVVLGAGTSSGPSKVQLKISLSK